MGSVALLDSEQNTTSLKSILVTGAAGFIGENFVLEWLDLDLAKVFSSPPEIQAIYAREGFEFQGLPIAYTRKAAS